MPGPLWLYQLLGWLALALAAAAVIVWRRQRARERRWREHMRERE